MGELSPQIGLHRLDFPYFRAIKNPGDEAGVLDF
jgi:hypothetical protein